MVGGDSWGWRLALGFAFVPSFLLFIGGTFLPDSPNSLLERGYPEQVTGPGTCQWLGSCVLAAAMLTRQTIWLLTFRWCCAAGVGGSAPQQRQPPIKETCLVDLMLLSVTTRLDPARLMVSGRARCALAAKPRRPFCRSGRSCAQALKNLQKVRGTKDVHKEFNDMKDAAELAAAVKCVLGC